MTEQLKNFEGESRNSSQETNLPTTDDTRKRELVGMKFENTDFSEIENIADIVGLKKIEFNRMTGFGLNDLAEKLNTISKLINQKIDDHHGDF